MKRVMIQVMKVGQKTIAWALAGVLLGSGCGKRIEIKAVKASYGKVETTVSTVTSGTIEAQNEVILSFGLTGKVKSITVRLGETVVAGQRLASLENQDLEILLANSQKELKRNEQLMSEGLISTSALDESKKIFESAKANFEKTLLVAPFAGVVSELNLQVGEVTGASGGKVPLRLVDTQPRFIRGQVDEIDLAKVKTGAPVRLRIPSVRAEPYAGQVTKVVPYISTSKEQERTATIEIKLIGENSAPNTKSSPTLASAQSPTLLPVGASVDIEIVSESKEKALSLPTKALLGGVQNRFVYIVQDEKLVKTSIRTGIGNYEAMEILEGLVEGQTVALPSDMTDFAPGLKVKAEIQKWPLSK